MSAWLGGASRMTNRLTEAIVALLAAFFTALLIVAVFSRYVFDISIVTSVEMTRIAFVWAVFLAAASVTARGAHVRIVAGVERLPERFQMPVGKLVNAIMLAFGIAMVWYGCKLTVKMMPTTLPAMQISQAWIYAALPVSGALISLHALAAMTGDDPMMAPDPEIEALKKAAEAEHEP